MLRTKGVRRALLVLGLALAALPATAGNALAGNAVGAVYVQSNATPNYVRVFYRGADGSLTAGPHVLTGGNGSATAPPLGLAITDSAGAVTLTENNNFLLVTNSGSNTVSSFRVLPDGNIVLADQESSGGVFPVSVAVAKGIVYVLNEGATTSTNAFGGVTGSVSGLTLDSQGNLTPIAGSTRTITGGTNSAQVGFNNGGTVLTVTNRNHLFAFAGAPDGSISTWSVGKNGLLGPEVVSPAIGSGAPFGFAYAKQDTLLVSNNGTFEPSPGTSSSYALNADGTVTGEGRVEGTMTQTSFGPVQGCSVAEVKQSHGDEGPMSGTRDAMTFHAQHAGNGGAIATYDFTGVLNGETVVGTFTFRLGDANDFDLGIFPVTLQKQ